MAETTTWWEAWPSMMRVREVQVARATEHTVWLVDANGRQSRAGRVTEHVSYFPTREEAVADVNDVVGRVIADAEYRVQWLRDQLAAFNAKEAAHG